MSETVSDLRAALELHRFMSREMLNKRIDDFIVKLLPIGLDIS